MTSEHPVNLNRLIKCHIQYWWKNKFQVNFRQIIVTIGFKCLNHIHVGVSLISDKKRQEDINSDKN